MFPLLLVGQDDAEWKLVRNADGIKAYVKKQPNTKIRRVKVETIVEASLCELVSLIKDAESHKNWAFLNKKANIVDKIDKWHWIYYGQTELPWPISSRDYITKVCMSQDSIDYSVKIISVSVPEYLPEEDGFIRIRDIHSEWILNPLGNGTIQLTFELTVDIGGSIPIWFINLAVARGPTQTMEGLITEIEKGEYADCKLKYITEL